MHFYTIKNPSIGEFKSFNSKFIAYTFPFKDKSELSLIIDDLKKKHPKANHFCFAYKVGYQNEEIRAYDDGEPNGTAGKPILGQLISFNLINTLVVVVRYFGGTKLGTTGLIEAYKISTRCSITNSILIEDEFKENFKTIISIHQYYNIVDKIKKITSSINHKFDNEFVEIEVFDITTKINQIKNLLKEYY